MIQLVYVSSATDLCSRSDLLALLEKSRANNLRLHITGMLLYRDGNFIQVLEGDENAVLSLYGIISQDARHSGIIVLLKQTVTERQFPQWSMAFRDLASPEVRALPGFDEFLNLPLRDLGPGRAMRLLQLFKDNMQSRGVSG